MAQAGLHALVGAAAGKRTAEREWLVLGIILGSLFPDLDNYAVAVATVLKQDSHGLHRTFTHSLLAMLAALAVFTVVARLTRQPKWLNLGIGFAVGIGLHVALDLLLWFNGVNLLWPLNGWLNFWAAYTPPEWFNKLLDPAEFLFIALFFIWLARSARSAGTDASFLGKLRLWTIAMLVLLIVFLPLNFLLSKGFMTLYGLFYLFALTAAFIITIRMRATVEAHRSAPAG